MLTQGKKHRLVMKAAMRMQTSSLAAQLQSKASAVMVLQLLMQMLSAPAHSLSLYLREPTQRRPW